MRRNLWLQKSYSISYRQREKIKTTTKWFNLPKSCASCEITMADMSPLARDLSVVPKKLHSKKANPGKCNALVE